jgi:hypothetical protein
VVVISMTHRVAGPAVVLERAVRGMLAGDLQQRMTLRTSDKLQGLGAALTELRDRWRHDQERRESFEHRLEEALDGGGVEAARAVLREFRTPDATGREAA